MATFEGECCDMKDFSMKKKADYIKKCERNADGSLTVTYADGTVYNDYADTKENIDTIDVAMERQVEIGHANIGKFKGLMFLSGIAALAPEYLYNVGCNMGFIPEEQKPFFTCGAILVSLLGLKEIIKHAGYINEEAKFDLRDSMRGDLLEIANNYPNMYPHAFTGFREKEYQKACELIDKGEDPFAARNSDWYSGRTLLKIKKNIEKDKAHQLTLVPRKK